MIQKAKDRTIILLLDSMYKELDDRYFNMRDKNTSFLEITAYNKALDDIRKALKLD